jgi:hypothetical protein
MILVVQTYQVMKVYDISTAFVPQCYHSSSILLFLPVHPVSLGLWPCIDNSALCLWQCYASLTKTSDGEDMRRRGCFQKLDQSMFSCRTPPSPYAAVLCCGGAEYCNAALTPQYAAHTPPPPGAHAAHFSTAAQVTRHTLNTSSNNKALAMIMMGGAQAAQVHVGQGDGGVRVREGGLKGEDVGGVECDVRELVMNGSRVI